MLCSFFYVNYGTPDILLRLNTIFSVLSDIWMQTLNGDFLFHSLITRNQFSKKKHLHVLFCHSHIILKFYAHVVKWYAVDKQYKCFG